MNDQGTVEAELKVLVEAGIDEQLAEDLLKMYGTAQNVLLSQVCGETDVPELGEAQARDRDALDVLVQSARDCNWEETNLLDRHDGIADLLLGDDGGFTFLQRVVNEDSATVDSSHQPTSVTPHEDNIMQLTDMGFPRDNVLRALTEHNGDLNGALTMLLQSES